MGRVIAVANQKGGVTEIGRRSYDFVVLLPQGLLGLIKRISSQTATASKR